MDGGLKIVLDHVRVYIINVCTLWISSLLVVYDAIDNASSSRATRTENNSQLATTRSVSMATEKDCV